MITFCSFISLKPVQKAIFCQKNPNNGNKKWNDPHFKPGNPKNKSTAGKKVLIIPKKDLNTPFNGC
jgi:hypothetical protein